MHRVDQGDPADASENMSAMSTHRDASPEAAVTPMVSPTVPMADAASKKQSSTASPSR